MDCSSRQPTKLSVGVGSVRINGILDGLVVALDGDLVLAGTALVLVVVDLAGGDLLSAHDCVVEVVVCVRWKVVIGCRIGMIQLLVMERI